jgi:anti-sigma B factor antagonist
VSAITYSVEQGAGRATVALQGELDIAAVAELEPELERLERDALGLIVLDLRGLTFLDSSGIRMILAADARAREQGRRLALVPGPEPVHRIFELALLDRRLDFVPDPSSLDSA